MADKLMYIPNEDTPNYPFCRLQLKVELNIMNQPFKNSLKSPKLQQIRKRYFITLGTSLINSPMSLPSLAKPLFLELFIYLMNTIKCFYFFNESRECTILKIYFIQLFVNKIHTFYEIF